MGIEVFGAGGAAGEIQACSECHTLEHPEILPGAGLVPAPDLTGHGSEEWLSAFIRNPSDARFYGDQNDRMPGFEKRLSADQIQLLVRWMRGDWYELGQEAGAAGAAE
jgi:mono/diheme cytochrome c family protein